MAERNLTVFGPWRPALRDCRPPGGPRSCARSSPVRPRLYRAAALLVAALPLVAVAAERPLVLAARPSASPVDENRAALPSVVADAAAAAAVERLLTTLAPSRDRAAAPSGAAEPVRLARDGRGRVRAVGTPRGRAFAVAPSTADRSPAARAGRFLADHGAAFGIASTGVSFDALRTVARGDRAVVRFEQAIGGLPVFGASVLVQLDALGGVEFVLADVARDDAGLYGPGFVTAPRLGADAAAALATAVAAPADAGPDVTVSAPRLMLYEPAVIGEVGPSRLVWQVRVTGRSPLLDEMVLVDAATGTVVLRFSQVMAAKSREVYDCDGLAGYACPLARGEGAPSTGRDEVDAAYDYLGDAYDFYAARFGRDSVDDAGLPLVAFVRHCDTPAPCPVAASRWDDFYLDMTFGHGWALADDVVAHEVSHGVTQFSSGLIYWSESGAIGEALADIFGELVDLDNGAGNDGAGVRWLIGEDLPGGAIRSLADPTAYGQPDRRFSPAWSTSWADNRGVHANAGVAAKLAFLLADGGSFNGQAVTAVGTAKVAELFYEAQVALLGPSSDYADLYEILRQAAINRGWSSAERDSLEATCRAVEIAWAGTVSTPVSEGFEGGFPPTGWSVSDPGGTGTTWGRSTSWSAAGAASAWCAGGGANARPEGDIYVDNMDTWLVVGPVSLVAADEAWLEFDAYSDVEPPDSQLHDYLFFGVSTDGSTFQGTSIGPTPTAVHETLSVRQALGSAAHAQAWFGFRFRSDFSSRAFYGAFVDNVVVRMVSSAPPCPAVTVSSVTPTAATVNQGQTFTALASGGTIAQVRWEWGDGQVDVTSGNTAAHAYATTGQKSLRVTATNSCGSAGSLTVTVDVGAGSGTGALTLVASPNPVDAGIPATITFSPALAAAGDALTIAFGDGQSAQLAYPACTATSCGSIAHAWAAPGTFTVSASGTINNQSQLGSTQVVVAAGCTTASAPVASFRVETASPRANQPVQFVDQSAGVVTTWLWDFGDGFVSSLANPSHAYQQAGSYTVALTAANCRGSSSAQAVVVVGEDDRPVSADFTWQPATITTGVEVTFTAAAGAEFGDPDTFSWRFSDESQSRSGKVVARTFPCAGIVEVTLTAARGSVTDSETKTVAVTGARCSPLAVLVTDAAKTPGANGTYWQTDLWVFNPSAQATQVHLAVLNSGGDNAAPVTVGPTTVGPKATLYLHDVLEVLSQQAGQDYRKGSVRVTFDNASDTAPVVTARTFTPSPSLPGGYYGQASRGVPVWPNSTAGVQWLTGLRNDGMTSGFRTNFGLLNLRGDVPADPVTVTLFGSTGGQLGRQTFTLPPNGYLQDSVANLFGASLAAAGPFALRVELPTGTDVEANASVVENRTGDPMQVVATVPQATPLVLPAIARGTGANGTVWRSSLQLTNPTVLTRGYRVAFTPSGGGATVSRTVDLRAGYTQFIEDVVNWVYAAGGASPPEQTAGVVKLTSADGSGLLPVAVARTYNVTAVGTFGHAIPALSTGLGASAGSATTRLVLPGLSSEDVARSNLGFVNLGEGGAVSFDVYFYGEDGTLLNPEGRPYALVLPAGGWDQDRIENRFNGHFGVPLPANQRAITAVVEVRNGSSGFAYASVVDNVTGDPIWISGQLQP